jgi:predicted RNA binding protein YcfA (HicA-like mRNA interferase family)
VGKQNDGKIPKVLNHDSMKRVLEDHGWVATVGGRHVTKMEKEGERPVTIPRHSGNDFGRGLRAAILREAGVKTATSAGDDMDTASGE